MNGGITIDEGDRAAWQALYEQNARDMLRYLLKLTGQISVAEELLQESFARGMRAGLDGVESRRAWLFRIATNAARDLHRADVRRPVVPISGAELDERPVFDVEVDLIHGALSSIAFDDATLLLLHFDSGLSRAEIARQEGATEEAIKSRLRRAKERFMDAYFRQQRGDR